MTPPPAPDPIWSRGVDGDGGGGGIKKQLNYGTIGKFGSCVL